MHGVPNACKAAAQNRHQGTGERPMPPHCLEGSAVLLLNYALSQGLIFLLPTTKNESPWLAKRCLRILLLDTPHCTSHGDIFMLTMRCTHSQSIDTKVHAQNTPDSQSIITSAGAYNWPQVIKASRKRF
jgi:hypothetical protein